MKERIHDILALAVTAPSGDNSQPWWFHIEGDALEVHLYPDRDNAILNYRLSGSYIAMGALIENIVILSGEHGLAPSVDLFPDSRDEHLVARVTFSPTEPRADPLSRSVPLRTTNRKPHKRSAVAGDAVEAIVRSGDTIAEGRIRVVTDTARIAAVGKASSVMERIALETPAIHRLFFESLVWDEEEETRRGVGLPLATTELPPPIRLLFRVIRNWKVANALNRIGLSRIAAGGNGKVYASSGAIGVVTTTGFDKNACVGSGRIFERAWLTATDRGLAFQPVTGLLFLAKRVREGKTEVFLPEHIPMIERAYAIVLDAFSIEDGEEPIMLFRLGHADPPSARTKRKAPEIR